jgi:hypothetical protein
MSLTDSISQAIATEEGFYKPGSIAQRNGNPGNLRSWGSRPIISGYAAFLNPDGTPDSVAGWAALYHQVDLNIGRGLNLYEFFGGKPGVYDGFSPSTDGNKPREYALFVASRTGLDPSIPLNQANASGSAPLPPYIPSPGETPGEFTDYGPIDDSVSSDLGSVNWGLLGLLGLGLLAVWWFNSD